MLSPSPRLAPSPVDRDPHLAQPNGTVARHPARTRVLVADDQALVRAGLRSILESQPDIDVVAEAADGLDAVRLSVEHRPNVVLMDIELPGEDGLAATRRVMSTPALSDVRVILLTTHDTAGNVDAAFRAGASGYLVKDTDAAQLVRAVRVVRRGHALIDPAVTRHLAAQAARLRQRPAATSRLRAITTRERQVMALVATGMSNDEIAAELVLSPATTKSHVSRILTKLGVRDRAGLVVLAYESGLVNPSWLG